VPVPSHRSHGPSHTPSQHTPSTQKPEPHCAAALHASPNSPLHAPLVGLHVRPLAQSAGTMHAVLHDVPSAHTYGWHDVTVGAHTPCPSQAWVVVASLAHTGAPHGVPDPAAVRSVQSARTTVLHAPNDLHRLATRSVYVPHVSVSVLHAIVPHALSSVGVPAHAPAPLQLLHVPQVTVAVGKLHCPTASHVPPQAASSCGHAPLQQWPPAHTPLWHCPSVVHAAPMTPPPRHVPDSSSQRHPASQSGSRAHCVPQWPPAHLKPLQNAASQQFPSRHAAVAHS
jgi:hypothetical protein